MKKKTARILSTTIIIIILCAVITVGIIYLSSLSPKRIFDSSASSIVELKAFKEGVGESYGTAVCVGKDGTFVSNAHVVTYKKLGQENTFDEYSIRLSNEEIYHAVELVKYDMEKDIAVLKLQDASVNVKPIKIGNSEKLSFGEKVYAIGNGSNYGLAITQGIISIPKVNIEYDGITREVIQSDITISAGNSGGALLDSHGKLIGITTFRTKDNQGDVVYGLVYSIPIKIVMEYINQQ